MPHAAFYVVQLVAVGGRLQLHIVSMPHAAFYVVQPRDFSGVLAVSRVSMPHAAFYVVQHETITDKVFCEAGFNAARGFLCSATYNLLSPVLKSHVSMPHAAFYVVQLVE